MKKLIVANWKLNPDAPARAEGMMKAIARGVSRNTRTQTVICPPFPIAGVLAASGKRYGKLDFGAQDCFWENEGPYTGQVSPALLKKAGMKYVILGHSEVRRISGETDLDVSKKVRAALRAGLIPILCIGESVNVRRKGGNAATMFMTRQLRDCLKDLEGDSQRAALVKRLVIAYEPVWAISTTKKRRDETVDDAVKMIVRIKKLMGIRWRAETPVLYGGSVNRKNAGEFLTHPVVDGALVGGASLRPAEFVAIVRAAESR